MDKLTMAHEMALKIAESGVSVDICAGLGWRYADAMQAEADKRTSQKRAELRELLNHSNTFVEKEGQHFDDVEFEVDWDLAPPEATTWKTVNNVAIWIAAHGQPLCTAPTFGFTGSCVVGRPEMEAECHG
ncbi:hypothetical protein [Acinetobacter sp. CFCC 10889]|uniref:hypothetical protein n=1 Tax=Acinetobacter sp. CFCC 10889 TaxID=1775557 RepID=UPI000DD032E7|nr:hypothetical protein [Acinetobacter sp. CFCC 10889]